MKTTIRDIVYQAAIFGQLDEVVTLIEQDHTLHTVDGKVVSDDDGVDTLALQTINLLVRCCNLSIAEIASEYIPLTRREILTSVDGGIEYDKFDKTLIDIISVSQRGTKRKYKMRPDIVELPDGRYEIEYKYLPQNTKFENEIDYKTAQITARIVAYGTICEYSIISGMQDNAVMWDGRFREALVGATSRGEKRIKERRWV